MSLRVFAPAQVDSLEPGKLLALDDEEARYLIKVRRARVGQAVELLDGLGQAFEARVHAVDRGGRSATIQIESVLPAPPSWPRRTLLLGSIDKVAALEAVTDAVVMGVDDLAWVDCARSQGIAPSPARIERAIRAAQRQCGRPDRPRLARFGSLAAALDADFPGELVWASLAEPQGSASGDSERGPVPTPAHLNAALRLAIGPEGGFDADEVALMRAADAHPIRVAPWVLRSERAVVATLARLFDDTSRPASP